MSTIGLIIVGGAVAYTSLLTPSSAFRKTAIDFSVHDEQGIPVEGVHAEYYHMHWIAGTRLIRALRFIPALRQYDTYVVKERIMTDAQGKGRMRFRTAEPEYPKLTFSKDGWYQSQKKIKYEAEKNGIYFPYPVKLNITMREITNPVALITTTKYALDYQIQSEEPVGFDFMLEDWMPPYGKGKVQDAVITVTPFPLQGLGSLISICEITFQGEDNGIQGIHAGMIFPESTLIYPHEAFEDGYTNQHLRVESFVKKTTIDKAQKINLDADYFFIRLRTQKDEDGNIISANYGVILYPINAGGRDNFRRVRMSYLINPTPNDRNLEPARNERGVIIPYTEPLPE